MPLQVDAATETMIRNLEEKTGRSIEAWIALARDLGPRKHSEVVAHLKSDGGLTHGYANLVAHLAVGQYAADAAGEDEVVAAQYAGDKAALKPIYERLVAFIGTLGDDVELSPKKAYVAARRSKQFAILQPSTKTRFDLGLQLKGVEPAGRLEASGSFSAMVTHRVRIESLEQVDDEVLAWLRQAYAAA